MKYIIFATVLNSHKMESKEYFEKVMQDHNQNRKGRSLRKYCKDEAVDYDWLPVQEELSFTGETSGSHPRMLLYLLLYPSQ